MFGVGGLSICFKKSVPNHIEKLKLIKDNGSYHWENSFNEYKITMVENIKKNNGGYMKNLKPNLFWMLHNHKIHPIEYQKDLDEIRLPKKRNEEKLCFNVSIDLIKISKLNLFQMKKELELYDFVNNNIDFFERSYINFMNLKFMEKKNNNLEIIPCKEIDFIWKVHMDNHNSYIQDNINAFGKILQRIK